METLSINSKRVSKVYSMFGESIKYAGPDCGLGAWHSQETAAQLMTNVAKGISDFRKGL